MSSNNIRILFLIHKTRLNKQLQAPLYLRISYNNQRKSIATGYHVDPLKWDNKGYRVKGHNEIAQAINTYIQQTQSRLISLYNEMLKEGDISLDKLVDRFFGRDNNPMTLMELVKYHNEDFHKRIGIDYVRSAIPLLPVALVILGRYQGKSSKLLPCYAIQKFNSYLGEIADLCGVNKNLTSHVGKSEPLPINYSTTGFPLLVH